MSIFSRIFSAKSSLSAQPDVRFGRYSDAYKTEAKYDAWDRSVTKYQQEDHEGMLRDFFFYLADEKEDNVRLTQQASQFEFEIYQGSKKIIGKVTRGRFRAEAKIAKVEHLHIGFMRRLIEDNYNLKYGRYCLDEDNDISIVFDSQLVDGSPYKLYYGLKEIALAADKQDDLFLDEFQMLSPVNVSHITEIPIQEKEVKIRYINTCIGQVLDEIAHGQLDTHRFPGGITYLLLDTIYRLDFLTRPEGHTMEAFERMHRSFFAADGLTVQQKNHQLEKELRELLARPAEKTASELYRTRATFGFVNATGHEKLAEIIQGELHNMDWYIEHNHAKVALAVPGYIVGHALFYYSLPEPDKDLLLLYFQIMEYQFFNDLGFSLQLNEPKGLNRPAIQQGIKDIVHLHQNRYPNFAPNLRMLKYHSEAAFAKSYLQMLSILDLNRI